MVYYDDEDEEVETVPKRVYVIVNDEKHYIDPEIVKKYNLEKEETTYFSGLKLYVEKD